MQQSDQLLINSLKDFIQIPQHIQSLSDIKADQIFKISITILQSLGIDVNDIRQIQKQKFRSTTKLNQKINKELQIQLQLNDLLNPTTSFIRKTILAFLSKLGSNQNTNANLTKESQENAQKGKRKKILSQWIDDQWIHPSLVSQMRPNYNAYLFPLSINRKNIKNNILPQLLKPTIKNNILPVMITSINKNLMKQKQNQLNTGITKRKNQQSNVDMHKLITSNFEDWNIAEQKLNKIKKKIDKDKQNIQNARKEEEIAKIQQNKAQQSPQVQSVFQIQVQNKIQQKEKQKQTIKQSVISSTTVETSQLNSLNDNPIQKIKKDAQNKKQQYQKLIQQLMQQLNSKRQQLQKIQYKKQKITTQLAQDQQKIVQYKTKTDELKKQVEKKQLVLTAVQSPKQIQEEIKKYEQDIQAIQQQVRTQVQNTTKNIQVMKQESQKKLQALNDLKIKLHRIQIEYKDVCQQIQQKLQRKDKIKINKSGISRNYYSKKISEIDKRWRETQKEVTKIKKDLDSMKQKTKIITDQSDAVEREIVNLLNSDRNSKTEAQTKALKDIFAKCQNCFKSTVQTLSKINQVKQESREYQVKVHTLTSQNYKQGIQKVNFALTQLKKQIQQLSKKKGSK